MKSTYNYKKGNGKKLEYPKLVQLHELKVLAYLPTSENTFSGTVVSASHLHPTSPIGYYAIDWDIDSFEDVQGNVTLSND